MNTNTTQGGTVSVGEDGFIYTPAAGFTGMDSLTFTVSDGRGGEATGVVSIRVLAKGQLLLTEMVRGDGNTEGYARIVCAGDPGVVYQILGSTDLVNWTVFGTVTADNGGWIEFVDDQVRAHPACSYRIQTEN